MNAAKTRFRGSRLRRNIALTLGLVVTALALSSAIGSAGNRTMLAERALGGTENVAAVVGVGVENPSPRLAEIVSVTTTDLGSDASAALKSLRLLRNGLGTGKNGIGNGEVSLYSFSPSQDGMCLVVWERSVVCSTAASPTPGVLWVLDGGYTSDVVGSPGDAPPAVVGLVSDNVKGVTLTVDGTSIPVGLTNNTFFHELPPSAGEETTSRDVGLRVTYRDGSTALANIR